jgi:leucyl-tRNA synthetase
LADILARYNRIHKHTVINPIGWDSFGLPADTASIIYKIPPKEWTDTNIAQMKTAIKTWHLSFDWHREISTCEPEYYKWTQWIFLKLFKKNMVVRNERSVNWDPNLKTGQYFILFVVLANEQVVNGRGDRSGVLIESKTCFQYFFKTTVYAQDLYDNLSHLDWPLSVKTQQMNWINPQKGLTITGHCHPYGPLECFTSSEDVSDVISYIAIGPSHCLISILNCPKITKFCKELLDSRNNSHDRQKSMFTELYFHSESLSKKIPIYIAGYLSQDPQSCFLGQPNDFKSHYEFAINNKIPFEPASNLKLKDLKGVRSEVKFGIRDWLVSRQRKWGTPIPIIHCKDCGIVPVSEHELPVTLEQVNEDVNCPKCFKKAKRETDTLDTFVDSSWYWLRFLDSKNGENISNVCHAVDFYVGGKEHSISHLIYARFISKFLHDEGLIHLDGREPFKKFIGLGMVKSLTYVCPDTLKYLNKDQIENGMVKLTGKKAIVSLEKMSKSKFNGIEPKVFFLVMVGNYR